MFKEERAGSLFRWTDLGAIAKGRIGLGPDCPVAVYRLMQYTLRDVLIADLGVERTNAVLRRAGHLAGKSFYQNALHPGIGFDEFLADLQRTMKNLRIGILRMEKADQAAMRFTFTVSEDLDCSGLPFSDEVICHYDEGFFAGVLEAHTGRRFSAAEIDCWASGDRVCRFDVKAKQSDG